MAEKIEPPPTPTTRDRLVEIASTAAGELPLAGTVVEVLQQIFGTAYEHRREAWIRRLYELVVELDERGVDVDALAGRPAFVTAVHDASRIAMGRAYSVPGRADTSRTQRTTRGNLNGDTSDIPPAQSTFSAGHGAARWISFVPLPS
jgi:hypothetical protein